MAIEYRAVSFAYQRAGGADGREALRDITLDVRAGQRLGILGPNGGGKSTLLKLTLGLLRGYSGSIRVFGRTPEEAGRLLAQNLPLAKPPRIRIFPSWWLRMPFLSFRIEVVRQ